MNEDLTKDTVLHYLNSSSLLSKSVASQLEITVEQLLVEVDTDAWKTLKGGKLSLPVNGKRLYVIPTDKPNMVDFEVK